MTTRKPKMSRQEAGRKGAEARWGKKSARKSTKTSAKSSSKNSLSTSKRGISRSRQEHDFFDDERIKHRRIPSRNLSAQDERSLRRSNYPIQSRREIPRSHKPRPFEEDIYEEDFEAYRPRRRQLSNQFEPFLEHEDYPQRRRRHPLEREEPSFGYGLTSWSVEEDFGDEDFERTRRPTRRASRHDERTNFSRSRFDDEAFQEANRSPTRRNNSNRGTRSRRGR